MLVDVLRVHESEDRSPIPLDTMPWILRVACYQTFDFRLEQA